MSDDVRSAVSVRLAEMSDAPILASLMCQLGYETRTAEMEMRLTTILPDSRYRTLVAVRGGEVRGMIGTICQNSYEHNDPSARIIALIVAEGARGSGLGSALIKAAETDLAERNIMRLAVNTRLTRKDAHAFYEARGYERNGFRYVKALPALTD